MEKKIENTRKKIKSILPKLYELKCEIEDEFIIDNPINLEFIEYREQEFNGAEVDSFMRDKLSREYIHSIIDAYYELLYMYSYSIASNIISVKFEEKGESNFSLFWKYEVRNFYFRNFIPRFWSLLDYISFFIYQLSSGELVPKIKDEEPRRISFKEFEKNLSKILQVNSENYIGWLSIHDRKIIKNIFEKPFNKITQTGKNILKRYRDIITHRYLPGIDEMTISSEKLGTKTRASEQRKLYSIGNDKRIYDYYGYPEFRFSILIKIAKILLVNITDLLNDLGELQALSSIIKKS